MRKPKFRTAKEIKVLCQQYFSTCDNNTQAEIKIVKGKEISYLKPYPLPYTVPGLAVHLGYADRHSLYDLKQNKKFSHVVKMALSVIENHYIQRSLLNKFNASLVQFLLRAGYGYKEYSGIEISGPGGGAIQLTGVPHKQLSLDEFRALAKSVYEKDFKHSKPYLEERSTIVDPVLDVADTNTIARDTDIQD